LWKEKRENEISIFKEKRGDPVPGIRYRGEAGDRGIVDTYYHADGDRRVTLHFSGDDILPINMEVVLHGAFFEMIDCEDTSRFSVCKLGDVPPRYFSEIVLQLAKAAASSTETRRDPN